jgi:two-component system chemotaxis response regulator CheY
MEQKLPDILIVDDSATTRGMIKRVIAMAELPVGHIFEAENGQVALELLKSNCIELVLADLNMPIMDGAEMIRQMREIPSLRAIPALVISAQPDRDRIAELKAHGVIGYLAKPFTAEAVRDLIGPYLKRAEVGWPSAEEGGISMNLTLIESFAEALETMAFITPELAGKGQSTGFSTTGRMVHVLFQGNGVHGKLMLAAPLEFGVSVAENCGVSGIANAGDDALKELANVTCGLMLRRRKGGARGFELAPPLLTSGNDTASRFPADDSVVLNANGYLVAARVTTDQPLFEE